MANKNHPETAVSEKRSKYNSATLKYPEDHTTASNWTTITFYEINRGNPMDKPKLQLPESIVLPIPFSGFEDNNSLKYDQAELGAIGGALGTGSLTSGLAAGGAVLGKFALKTLIGAGADLASEKAGSVGAKGVGDAIQSGAKQAQAGIDLATGIAQNPNISLLFKGVNLRKHQFGWRMIAKSATESNTIDKIIKTIRRNSLPTQGDQKLALFYPKVAFIEFNPSIIKFSDMGCFITDIQVKYDGAGHPSFYKDTGAPVVIDLSITLEERFILTSEDYK